VRFVAADFLKKKMHLNFLALSAWVTEFLRSRLPAAAFLKFERLCEITHQRASKWCDCFFQLS
jgi:hypothetical protein